MRDHLPCHVVGLVPGCYQAVWSLALNLVRKTWNWKRVAKAKKHMSDISTFFCGVISSCLQNLVFYPDIMCISARRSIGTDLKCGFASHCAFCGIVNYEFVSVIQETSRNRNVGNFGCACAFCAWNLEACLWSLQQMASSWPLLPPSSSAKWASLHPLIVVPIFAPR